VDGMALRHRHEERRCVLLAGSAHARSVSAGRGLRNRFPHVCGLFLANAGKFDVNESNDVLPRTLVARLPGRADLGAFGYKPTIPARVLISHLPEKYSGRLSWRPHHPLDGHPIADAHEFQTMMTRATEEAHAVVMIQRGKVRTRVETRILVPTTFRAYARFRANTTRYRNRSSSSAAPSPNARYRSRSLGRRQPLMERLALEKIDQAGCVLLTIDKELLHAGRASEGGTGRLTAHPSHQSNEYFQPPVAA